MSGITETTKKGVTVDDLSKLSKQLCEDTGSFVANDAMTAFLYLLMRDHVPIGVVGELTREAVAIRDLRGGGMYTNGYLAQYAQWCADKLGDDDE